MTPPSAIASRNMQAKAGPDPDRAVQASKCFSSRKRQRPIEENIFRIISLFNPSASEGGRFETTVMPSRICQASHIYCRRKYTEGTHATWCVGHCADDRRTGKNPVGKLRYGDTGEDTDKQLPGESFFDTTLVKNEMRHLWFATERNGRHTVARSQSNQRDVSPRTHQSKTTSDCCTAAIFCPTMTSIASPPTSDLNVPRRRLALSSRLTHAMNREGSVGSLSVTFVGVEVPGV